MVRERIKFQAFEIFQANLKFPSMTNGQIGTVSIIQKLLENRLYLWAQQEIIYISPSLERFKRKMAIHRRLRKKIF